MRSNGTIYAMIAEYFALLLLPFSVYALVPAASRMHSPKTYILAARVDLDYSDDRNGLSAAGLRFGTESQICMLAVDGAAGRLRADFYRVEVDGSIGSLQWQAVASTKAGAVQRLMRTQTKRGVTAPVSCTLSPMSPWESALLRAAMLSGRSDTEAIKIAGATAGSHCFGV